MLITWGVEELPQTAWARLVEAVVVLTCLLGAMAMVEVEVNQPNIMNLGVPKFNQNHPNHKKKYLSQPDQPTSAR